MLPTFIVIGAPRCGTTSLHEYLTAHPDVFMVQPKEPNFFSNRWEDGVGWYESLFGAAPARGEVSPNYSCLQYPDVPKRIASVVPDVRLVYLIRDPVERIRSYYVLRWREGHETRPFVEAVEDRIEYRDDSRYADVYDRYLEYFPAEQILVTEMPAGLDSIYDHIGVTPIPAAGRYNTTSEWTRQSRGPAMFRNAAERLGLRRLMRPSWRAALRRTLIERPLAPPDTSLPPEVETELRDEYAPQQRAIAERMPRRLTS